MANKVGSVLRKIHEILKPHIYLLSALVLLAVGAYLLGQILPILNDPAQPSWTGIFFGIVYIVVLLYWAVWIMVKSFKGIFERGKKD